MNRNEQVCFSLLSGPWASISLLGTYLLHDLFFEGLYIHLVEVIFVIKLITDIEQYFQKWLFYGPLSWCSLEENDA